MTGKWFNTVVVIFIHIICVWPPVSFCHEIKKSALQSHVAFLSSDLLEGRLSGSEGERLAAQYAADFFQSHGLEPAGDHGSYFQNFTFTSGFALGKNNALTITRKNGIVKKLKINQDWRPLSFSENKFFESHDVVFAGYGITASASGALPAYDSYHGLNVKNKWVLVFRFVPENISDDRRRQLIQYASPRYKAFIAKEKGASGIIFVSGPNANVKNELIPLTFDTSLSKSGIVAISVTNDVAKNLLFTTYSLKHWQDQLDSGEVEVVHASTDNKITGLTGIQRKHRYARNVVARLKVGVSLSSVVIGAHLDHLGRGELSGSRSRENEQNLIHYGADDNASGVASVLEVAAQLAYLKAQKKLDGNKDIIFSLWSGEELGLLGSAHFVKKYMESAHTAIDTYVNLDMIGRLRKNLILQGIGSSPNWSTLILQANKQKKLSFIFQNDPYLPTDATSFYLHGVPTINIFTGSHDEYHTPRDKPDILNYEGIKDISQFLVDVILKLENKKNRMAYQKVKNTDIQTGRGFRIYLGTIPDYASADLVGVKLSGVSKYSPAEKAGLRQGDVIVELAGKKIRDIYDYTYAMNALHAGKPVALIVQRDQQKVILSILPQSRE